MSRISVVNRLTGREIDPEFSSFAQAERQAVSMNAATRAGPVPFLVKVESGDLVSLVEPFDRRAAIAKAEGR